MPDKVSTNTTAAATPTATTLTVRNTANFPAAGSINVYGETIPYTSKTPTTFAGLTRPAGAGNIPAGAEVVLVQRLEDVASGNMATGAVTSSDAGAVVVAARANRIKVVVRNAHASNAVRIKKTGSADTGFQLPANTPWQLVLETTAGLTAISSTPGSHGTVEFLEIWED